MELCAAVPPPHTQRETDLAGITAITPTDISDLSGNRCIWPSWEFLQTFQLATFRKIQTTTSSWGMACLVNSEFHLPFSSKDPEKIG